MKRNATLSFPGFVDTPAPEPDKKKRTGRKKATETAPEAVEIAQPDPAHASAGEQDVRKVVDIQLAQIIPSRYQSRLVFPPDRMRELQSTIELHGVLQPILVREPVDGEYELIAGECRVRACRELTMSVIPAIIIAGASEKDIERIAVAENGARTNLSDIEWCHDARRKLEQRAELGASTARREVEELYGVKKAEISRRLTIAHAIDEACIKRAKLAWIDLQPVPMYALYVIARIEDETRRARALANEVERRSGPATPATALPAGATIVRREKSAGVVMTEYHSGTRAVRIDPNKLQTDEERQRCIALLEEVRAWIDSLEVGS